MAYFRSNVLVCSDPECIGKGSEKILESLLAELNKKGLAEEVKSHGHSPYWGLR